MEEMTTMDSEEQIKLVDNRNKPISKSPQPQRSWKPVKILVFSVVGLMSSVLFLALIFKKLHSDHLWNGLDFRPFEEDVEANYTWPADKQQEKLLGGLLSEGLDEKSCVSRYQFARYRKGPVRRPSPHLISRLRSYEALHKRCGPYTESFNRSLEYFKSGRYNSSAGPADCKYIVWLTRAGLGNRMITLASSFLYALLTNRILLVDPEAHFSDLFCEPFPETSWLVPSDFPIIDEFGSFNRKSRRTFGNLLKKNAFGSSKAALVPSYVYLHLVSDYTDDDKRFFCDQDHTVLQKVPWLLVRSDLYFAPSLFLMPSFQQELADLFPEKETVFHFLGRYLFHPANAVWRAIVRYYNDYLANADETIAIQVRVLDTGDAPFKQVMKQILGCVIKENILPRVNETLKGLPMNITSGISKTKAVLMTSLTPDYFEAVRDMYQEHPTVTGEVVKVYQPSHEEYQHSKNQMHNMKAWAEIYLLSLSDKLVTTAKSTFGYVAQSLGDLKPWILYKPEDYKPNSDPVCQRGVSMEPCFQAPPNNDCKSKRMIDIGKMVPYIRHCEDMNWNWGLKLFGEDGES
ncbi:OLC1v1012477C3 [Oldenlandia corymbosa var. corymbosa]|uniref:Fucosyltransferase n=1 Tax=Oldenlandia corymbosa var. corymbosa TaxID=529605 RepID=A0AAV1DXV8_OLDCO|nr:OLC1v1012477C3 [Oldenlandia corymbosa var. corymbosa]